MTARAGRSGPRRKPASHHLATGNYRASRHGALPASLAADALLMFPSASASPPVSPPPVPAGLLDGLAPPAQAFVEALWAEYQFTAASLPLLRLAGEQMQRLHDVQQQLAASPLVTTTKSGSASPNPCLRLEQRAVRNLIDLIKTMNLEPNR